MAIVSFMVRQQLLTRPVANVLWFEQDNVGEGGLQSTADQIGDAYAAFAAAGMTADLELIDTLVRVWNGGSPFSQVVQPAAFPTTGGLAVSSLPANVALLVSTSHTGPRPNRGRVYLAGLAEASWDGDSWDATITGLAEAFADALLAVTDAQWVIARPNAAANTAIANGVTDAVVRGYAGSQRGRRF